eukprot:3438168-Prymnesium_polylepis.1
MLFASSEHPTCTYTHAPEAPTTPRASPSSPRTKDQARGKKHPRKIVRSHVTTHETIDHANSPHSAYARQHAPGVAESLPGETFAALPSLG